MKKINFENGHHLDISTMNFIQSAYTAPIKALAKEMQLTNYIVSGVVRSDVGAIVTFSDGWIMLNGELLEFRGGSFNGNTSDEYYVVKRTETGSNINIDGQTKQVLITEYATLGAYEENAVSILVLDEYRLVNFVTAPYKSGTISLGISLVEVDDDDEAAKYSYISQAKAKPRYGIYNNHLIINGVFHRISQEQSYGSSVTLGVLSGWSGMSVARIKVDIYYLAANGSTLLCHHGSAGVSENGNLNLFNEVGERFMAAVFDGSHTFITKKATE